MTDFEIINTALKAAEETTAIPMEYHQINPRGTDEGIDGELIILKNGHRIKLKAEIIIHFRKHHLIQLLEMKGRIGNLVIIADYIPSLMREALRTNGIGYLDSSGNVSIEEGKFFLLIEGKKRRDKEVSVSKAFTKSGLKVVFALLAQPDRVNTSYRVLSEKTGSSLDTISKTFKALKKANYLLTVDKKTKALNKHKKLLDRWAIDYVERLKPSLLVGRFRFLKKEEKQNWDRIALRQGFSMWGGEPGADLLLNDLRPESWILYTRESNVELMKHYRLLPDTNGPIQVSKMFWNWEGEKEQKYVDPVLIFADLLESLDPRSIEMANRIYERFIKSKY